MIRSQYTYLRVLLFVVLCASGTVIASGQSSDQNFPSPITSSELSGTIKARDIGDSRLTRHYYAFDGGQGDIFINVVTKNFTGDIDVFTQEGLRPLTKMIIYADGREAETGRLIYLRKGERLLLRIEGRTPDDDPASYRIKFGGSFIALAATKEEAAPTVRSASSDDPSGIKVNSVGTIVAVTPKPKPPVVVPEKMIKPAEPIAKENVDKSAEVARPKAVTTEPFPVSTVFGEKKTSQDKPATAAAKKPSSSTKISEPVKSKPAGVAATPVKTVSGAKPPVEKAPDPLANIRLVVLLKSGEVIERPMSEVQRFGVEAGVLTVITKDGKASRYSILVVAKVTIE